jgi:hypothetical protein
MKTVAPVVRLLMLLFAVLCVAAGDARDVSAETTVTVRYVQRAEEGSEAALTGPIVVRGQILAGDTGNSLPYTNVFVAGGNFGTMAVTDGRFWLRGLAPGRYQLKARYISYEEGIADLDLRPGDIVEVEYVLDLAPVLFDTFEVRAERQLLVIQETGTARRIGSDEIGNLPVDDIVELVALQPGVVKEDNTIHIRGGRAGDTQFYVDGVSVNDPLSAGRYGVALNEDLVNEIEVLTGGFSAEYGQAVSGVVNVSTKEGGRDFESKLTYRTDQFAPAGMDYDSDLVRFTLSGPNLLWDGMKQTGLRLPGEQTFILSLVADVTDTYLPTQSLSRRLGSAVISDDFFSPRAQNGWSGLGKLTWRFDDTKKLNVTYSNQQEISLGFFLPGEGYPNKFRHLLDDYNVYTTQSILGQANWKHVLGTDSFYEVVVGRQFSRMHSNKNGTDDFSTYLGPEVNRRYVGEFELIEGAFVGGDSDRWHDHYSDTWSVKIDYAWIGNETNHLKTGIEYNYSDIQLVDLQGLLDTPPAGALARATDVFFAHPHVAAAYVQDRISYKGLILNAGLRLDGWAPGAEVDDVMSRPEDFIFIFDSEAESYRKKTYGLFGRRWKARLSPRVGLSFPVSERDKFFFNYGHFSQWPNWNYVYSQLQTDFTTQLRLLGNPNLDPKVTVQYETGIQHEFEGLWSAGITFYNNDIYGYAQSVVLDPVTIDPELTPDPNDTVAESISPIRYFNADAARSLGVEIHVEKRTTRYVSGRFTVEFQRSTGTSSAANSTFLSAQLDQASPDFETEEGIRLVPLRWDRPWSVTGNLNVFVGKRETPTVFGWKTPKNWNLNLLARAWAGTRYTAKYITPTGNAEFSLDENAMIGPYRSSIDFSFRKWWENRWGQTLTLFVEARNILDHGNYRRINPWTGQPYQRGNWDGDIAATRNAGTPRSAGSVFYEEDFIDPSYRTDPRQFFTGVSLEW